LIQNVAGFQVNYRVLNGADSQVLNAKQVEAAQLWASVKAVEICLDMQGTEKMPDAGSSYPDCQGVPRLRNGFVHLVYRNVFDLRVAGPLE
jgi:type IV pilus assembly protein PilW